MNLNSSPTKGNLILAKNSLALARQDYVLMNKKRDILVRELIEPIDQAKDIRSEIDMTFREAYSALQMTSTGLGINYVQEISASILIEVEIHIRTRSIMGTEIPLIQHEETPVSLTYAHYSAERSLDEAGTKFEEVKELTIKPFMVKNSTYRLTNNIKKTQKRASALENIMIPMYSTLTKNISNALEERERGEFTRLKIIKRNKAKAK